MSSERIVAIGLLTKNDVRLLGPTFDRLWPIEDAHQFAELLSAIDEAESRSPGQLEQVIGKPKDA